MNRRNGGYRYVRSVILKSSHKWGYRVPEALQYIAGKSKFRKYGILLGFTAAVIVSGYLALPAAINFGLTTWLSQNNTQQAVIENVELGLFRGEIDIFGLRVENQQEPLLQATRVHFTVDWPSIFSGRLHFHAMRLEGAQFDVTLTKNQTLRVAGFPLEIALQPDSQSPIWPVGLADTHISDLTLTLHMPTGTERVNISSMILGPLATWAPDEVTPFQFSAAIGKTTLAMNGGVSMFGGSPRLNADLSARDLNLSQLQSHARVEAFRDITGRIQANLRVDAKLSDMERLEAEVSGALVSNGVVVALKSTDGEIRFSSDQENIDSLELVATADKDGRAAIRAVTQSKVKNLRIEATGGGVSGEYIEWTGTVNAEISNGRLVELQAAGDLQGANLQAHSESGPNELSIGGVTGRETQVNLDLRRSGNPLLTVQGKLFANNARAVFPNTVATSDSTLWKGRVETSFSGDGTLRVSAAGDIETLGSRIDAPIDGETGVLTLARAEGMGVVVSAEYSASTGLQSTLSGNVSVEQMDAMTPAASLKNEGLDWTGHVSFSRDVNEGIHAQAEGRFVNRQFEANLADVGLFLQQGSARMEGKFTFDGAQDNLAPTFSIDGDAVVENVLVDTNDGVMRLMALSQLTLGDIAANGADSLNVGKVTAINFRGFRLNGKGHEARDEHTNTTPFAATLAKVVGNGIQITERTNIQAKSVRISGANIKVERQADGELRLAGPILNLVRKLSVPANGNANPDKSAKPGQNERRSWRVQVGEWNMGGDSRMTLADNSVTPSATLVIAPVDIKLGNIDTAEPWSDVPVNLSAKLGKYAALTAIGTIKPFSPLLNMDIASELKGFDLAALSGYTSAYMGYELTQGKVDSVIRARVKDGQLETDSELVITKLEAKPADPKLLAPLKDRLEVPLETALSLLKDSNDVIRLKVPVTGDVAMPNFDFSDAVNTAIGNAMKETVLTTLKLAFPLGGIIMTLAEADAHVELDPVGFSSLAVTLDNNTQAHLTNVAALLRDRPAVRLSICGKATNAELQAISAQVLGRLQAKQPPPKPGQKQNPEAENLLIEESKSTAQKDVLELARKRGEAVKDFLINREKVNSARLLLCAPAIETAEDAKPRAVMMF